MKRKIYDLSRKYRTMLQEYLRRGSESGTLSAQALGRRAMIIGLETLDMASIHEQALGVLILPGCSPSTRETMTRRAGIFFAEAIIPIEKTHRTALEATIHLGQVNQMLRQRSADLFVSTRQLKQEILERKSAEESLKQTEQHYGKSLEKSQQMQEQLRLLSRQLLSAQEEERKKISRELHDVIAQTLTGINVRLATLKKEAIHNTKSLERNIARTQKLVESSVDIVHRFARELRPTVLDDLGLIPALQTYMKSFQEQTGIRVSLTAFAAVEQLTEDKRTILYRVAQEALTNVSRHAQASETEVSIQKLNGAICMKIKDNGKGFQEERVLRAKKNRRLGLLGMRERLEMVGGNFSFISIPGKGTTIQARIPSFNEARESGKPSAKSSQH